MNDGEEEEEEEGEGSRFFRAYNLMVGKPLTPNRLQEPEIV
jgi:hypothetical protein